MKKRILSLALALVMCVGLVVPAFAVPVPPPEAEPVKSANAGEPRHPIYQMTYKIDMQNNTYAYIIFSIAERGGRVYFEDCVSVSFSTTNPGGSHWKIKEHSYVINEDKFNLCVTLMDMEGDDLSSLYEYKTCYTVFPDMVVSSSQSAEDETGVVLTPDSVHVRYAEEMKDALSAKDDTAALLIPDSVSISYPG